MAEEVDLETLSQKLVSIASPARLELLQLLRFHHTLNEIRLRPRRGSGAEAAAKQSVQAHLDKLAEVGLVLTDQVEEGGRRVNRYSVAPAQLYSLSEDLRRLLVLYEGHGTTGLETGTLGSIVSVAPATGPRLVLVHGAYEGKVFSLTTAGPAWILGRARDADVSLDYDSFVSVEHARLSRVGGVYSLADLGSKNGTALNWRRIHEGESATLRSGDVIGVGRSLLSFVSE